MEAGLEALAAGDWERVFEVFAAEGAVAACNEATQAAPADPQGWVGRGFALLARGKPQAVGPFLVAAALDPRNENAWRGVGAVFDRWGREEDSNTAMEIVAGTQPPEVTRFGVPPEFHTRADGGPWAQVQRRLRELGYLTREPDGVFSGVVQDALTAFQSANGLWPTGVPSAETQALLMSDAARARPEDVEEEPFELMPHLEHLRSIQAIQDPAARATRIVEALMDVGPELVEAIATLKRIDGSDLEGDTKDLVGSLRREAEALEDEAAAILVDWLSGKRFTSNPVELHRRAQVARMLVADQRGVWVRQWRAAARALLERPAPDETDQRLAGNALLGHLEWAKARGDGETQLLTIADLLRFELPTDPGPSALTDQGDRLLDADVPADAAYSYLLARMTYEVMQGVRARAGSVDRLPAHRGPTSASPWDGEARSHAEAALATADRMEALSAAYRVAPAVIIREAVAYDLLERPAEAAARFETVSERHNEPAETRRLATRYAARFRFRLGDDERVVELLEDLIPDLATRYVEAVGDHDVDDAGDALVEAVQELAYSLAVLGRPQAALRSVVGAKGLRLRHQAAIRRSPDAARILEIQRARHLLARGLTPQVEVAHSPVGEHLSIEDRLTEEHWRARPDVAPILEPPGVEDIAAALRPDEAFVTLAASTRGTTVAVLTAVNGGSVVVRAVPELTDLTVALLMAGKGFDGFLPALGAVLDHHIDPRPSLQALVDELDRVLVPHLTEMLADEHGSVVIVPSGFFEFGPFWALPGLRPRAVLIAPTASQFMEARSSSAVAATVSRGLVVADPTGDLPLSAAQSGAVRAAFDQLGLSVRVIEREDATESEVAGALPAAELFHFCGHGRAAWGGAPGSAALLVSPDWSRAPVSSPTELDELADAAINWRAVDAATRHVELADVGVLTEVRTEHGETRRTLEHQWGTLWAVYAKGGTPRFAELWTADDIDIALERSPGECALAFLSACSSGIGSVSRRGWEPTGLPAALGAAGVGTLIATLWPVRDTLTALYVHLFYRAFARQEGEVDVVRLVKEVNEQLRDLSRSVTLRTIAEMRSSYVTGWADLLLDSFARRVRNGPSRPFAHPYDWASFYVIGRGTVTIGKAA